MQSIKKMLLEVSSSDYRYEDSCLLQCDAVLGILFSPDLETSETTGRTTQRLDLSVTPQREPQILIGNTLNSIFDLAFLKTPNNVKSWILKFAETPVVFIEKHRTTLKAHNVLHNLRSLRMADKLRACTYVFNSVTNSLVFWMSSFNCFSFRWETKFLKKVKHWIGNNFALNNIYA
jgi:hypothetical protein